MQWSKDDLEDETEIVTSFLQQLDKPLPSTIPVTKWEREQVDEEIGSRKQQSESGAPDLLWEEEGVADPRQRQGGKTSARVALRRFKEEREVSQYFPAKERRISRKRDGLWGLPFLAQGVALILFYLLVGHKLTYGSGGKIATPSRFEMSLDATATA